MPKFSIFTPLGLLKLTAAPAVARVIFNAKISALGADRTPPAYASAAPGTRLEAKLYAESIREAVVRLLLRRAGETDLPDRIHPEMVPIREADYGVTPAAGDGMATRKGGLQAAYLLARGGSRYNIEQALRVLLGTGFIYYRTLQPGERVLYPASLGDQPMNLVTPKVPRVIVRLNPTLGISLPSSSAQTISYVPVLPLPQGGTPVLVGGEVLVIEPEISARTERVTVLAVGTDAFGAPTITAVFLQAHEPAAVCTTQPFPFWTSNQRYALIVVSSATAADPNQIRRIHILMRSLARTVSTWAIVEETAPNQAGPFVIGSSPLGVTPLGVVTYPVSPP